MTAPAPLTPQALDGLEEKARAAYRDYGLADIAVGGGERATVTVPAYIAALSPSTALALIAAARAGEEMREALEYGCDVVGLADEMLRHAGLNVLADQLIEFTNRAERAVARAALSKEQPQ